MTTKTEIDALFEEADALALVDGMADDVSQVDLGEGPEGAGTMTVRTSAPKGYVIVYDYVTGRPTRIAAKIITQAMRRKDRVTGAPLYTREPARPYVPGEVMCLLHPAHLDRERYDQMGLVNATCNHATLRSQLDLRQHMRVRHKREWDLVQAEEDREQRELQTAVLRQQVGKK